MIGSHGYVEPIVFFTCACTFSYITIQSEFVYQFVSESHNFTKDESVNYCQKTQNVSTSVSRRAQIVADEVASWSKIALLLQEASSAVSVLVITSWSEAIGRRNALFFPVIGAFLCSGLLLINIYFRISLIIYVVSSFIYGATGGWATLVNVGTAHLGDIIAKEKRGHRYVFLEMCSLIGGGFAQLGTGYWLNQHGFVPSMIFVNCCSVVALLFTGFLETSNQPSSTTPTESAQILGSDDDEGRQDNSIKRETGFGGLVTQLREVYRIYTSNSVKCYICDNKGVKCVHCDIGSKNRVWRLWVYVISYLIYIAAIDGFLVFKTMFFVSYPLCFTPDLVGVQSGLDSSSMVVSPLVILFLRSLLRFSVLGTILSAIIGRIVTCIFMFYAKGPLLVFIGTSIGALGHLTTPFLRVEVSNAVSPSEQGPALALIPSVAKMASIFTPLLILTVYTDTLHIRYSFIWAVMAIFLILSFLLISVVWAVDESPCGRQTDKEHGGACDAEN